MIAHYFCERMEEEFHRGLFFDLFLFSDLVNGFFDVISDIMRIFCSFEDKVIFIADGIEEDVTLTKKRIEK